jgi:transketolase
MPDSFGESGPPRELLEKYGLCCDGIENAVKKVIKRK